MAQCNWCKADMMDVTTTTCQANQTIVFPDKQDHPAVPYKGKEGSRCHDCNIAPNGYHHPGCDMERCPRCSRQLITCGCLGEENE